MASEMKKKALMMCFLQLMCLLSLSLTPVLSRSLEGGVADRKDYYSPPDPHGRHGHGGSPHGSHGSAGTPCTNPPPTGGGGSSGGASPTAPSYGSGGGNPPSSPVVITPPSTVPVYPTLPTPPSTPMFPVPDSNSPFSCDYWRTHPTAILTLLGYWCPLSQIFGLPNPTLLGSNPTLLEALSNPRSDGISALYRQGTAAYLNSLANRNFFFTSQQVRDALNSALVSDKAAAAQAEVFKRANEGHLVKHH
ncbi:hypothetical protein Cni_G23423 [Canna indica]|uniref:Protodermal factor 1 n=1 Tax=Canna indica TaxID=4628 RepID=A0AAQ3L0D3_9LILI|nr:hypothetical protein Cni_G23423 [Canna indica]